MKKVLVLNASQSKRALVRRLVDTLVAHIGQKGSCAITNFGDVTDATWNYEDVGDLEFSILYFDLKKLTYKGCIDCNYCMKHRGCMLRDDIKYMYRYFDEADFVILGTPIYFGGSPSKLKALIDRTQAIYHSKYTLHDSLIDRSKERRALTILAGGEMPSEYQFVGTKREIGYFYRAINTKEFWRTEISDSDHYDPNEDEQFKSQLIQKLDEMLEMKNE